MTDSTLTPIPTPADVAGKVDSPDGVNANPPTGQNGDPAQDAIDWKAESRKWEARAKENKDAAIRLAEIEEASKTEAEKVAERLAALEAENKAFKQREQIAEWAKEIAKDSHVPADLLRGSTLEELQAHHDQLAQIISKPDDTPAPAPFSGPTLLGIEPTGTGEAPLDAQIAAAEKEGNWVVAGQLKAMKLAQGQSTP